MTTQEIIDRIIELGQISTTTTAMEEMRDLIEQLGNISPRIVGNIAAGRNVNIDDYYQLGHTV